MNPSDPDMAALERDEQWFAGMCDKPTDFDVTRIKRHVRIAVEERWFAQQMGVGVPLGLAGRMRGAVRESVAVPQSRRRMLRFSLWSGAGLSAAAVLAIAFVQGPWRSTEVGEEDADVGYAAAFAQYVSEDAFDRELDELRGALSDYDTAEDGSWMDLSEPDGEVGGDGA